MAIKNLLRESIVEVKKLKEASTMNTKDLLLKKISEDLKKRLTENEFDQQDEDDDFIEDEIVEDEMVDDDDDILNDDMMSEGDEFDQEQEIVSMEQADDILGDLQNEETPNEDQEVYDEELDDIIEELQNQDDEGAITDDILDSTDDDLVPAEDDNFDQELVEKIRQILESQQDELQDGEQEIVQGETLDDLKTENKKLKKQNLQYKKHLMTLKKDINQTRCLQLKGRYVLKLFEKFNLSKPQKMKIVENFDRANSERQIKLVYATLMEGLSTKKVKKSKVSPRSSNYASSKMNSTRSKTNIKESLDSNEIAVSEIFKRRINL